MFLKTKLITTKRQGKCNAYLCLKGNKAICKGERVIWTLHTYRNKTISAIWHPSCHKTATSFAPDWSQLLAIKQGNAPLPSADYYDMKTGLPKQRSHRNNKGEL